MVRCNNSEIDLPISPATTSLDLILAAADVLSESVQPSTSILLESFTQLGLERRIRNYEHIRDIMNSWAHDSHNSLYLVPSTTRGDDEDLDVTNVADEQPSDTSVYVYHSQKPGKWDKRWVTLRSDGQVQIAKKDGAEASSICHLSDFDIYIPTTRHLSKRIRPPKRICFAVKSQQKSSIFLSTANFVHFFATNDKKVAASWYSAVQGWRSWYLVNVMGKGKTRDKPGVNVSTGLNQVTGTGVTSESTRHQKAPSTDSIPYQIGSFRPLLPPGHFQSDLFATDRPHTSSAEAPPVPVQSLHARKMSIRARCAPALAVPNQCTEDTLVVNPKPAIQSSPRTGAPPLQTLEATTFAPTSLLGRTYSHRQKTQFERGISSKATNAATPFADLLDGQSDQPMPAFTDTSERPTLNRTATARSARKRSVGPKRIPAQHQKPKPLIDLSPEYKEAPRHTRRGHGVIPLQIPHGGLVDVATSPEVPVPIPPAIAWRRPGTSNDEGPLLQRTSAARPSVDITRSSVKEEGDAFTGGLLARTGSSQGSTGKGRGLVTGDRHAKGPMLDVSEKSRFLPGSLLAHVEQSTGSGRPVIEREKRMEVNTAVGEGL